MTGQYRQTNCHIYPQVAVILLNWNNFRDSDRCLRSLSRASYPNLRVIVVDNGSTDGSGQLIADRNPSIEVLFNQENGGFSRGCNIGIRHALTDPTCEFVLLLNNDCIVPTGFLEPAVEAFLADPSVGLIGGKMLLSEDSRIIWYAGGRINMWRGQPNVRGFGQIDEGQYDDPGYVGFVTGAMMLVRREVFQAIGLLPDEYFFGTEEYDYSILALRHGYRLYYVPTFMAYHNCGSSRGLHSEDLKFIYLGYRQRFLFQEKYLPSWQATFLRLILIPYSWFLARRKWLTLRTGDQPIDKAILIKGMKFALRQAVKDHGRNRLDEDALAEFISKYRAFMSEG